MDFFQVLIKRRSIRKFSSKIIPKHTLYRLIDVIKYAPSSMNGQPWEVIIVKNKQMKEQLTSFKNKWCPDEKRIFQANFIKEAPVTIVVCVDKKKSYSRWIENGVIASTYIILSARALGLGSTFMTAYNLRNASQIKEVRKILNIPSTVNPVCIIPLGYSAEIPKSKKLKDIKEMIHYDRY